MFNTVFRVSSDFMFVYDCAKKINIMIGKLFKKKINLKFNKSYPDGTPRKLLDSSIIYSMGWKPIISIEKGLRETLKWYKENIK